MGNALERADLEALENVRLTGRVRGARADFRTMKLIAHGLAWDPHIDGRLKVTSAGHERLAEAAAPAPTLF